MKNWILLFLLLAIGHYTTAQTFCLDAVKTKVLYAGVENAISISPRPDSISADKATVKSSGYGNYTLTPNADYGQACKIKVYNGGKVMLIQELRIKRIPTPTPVVNNKRNGDKMTVGEAKASLGLVLILENFDFDLKIAVDSYEVIRIPKAGVRESSWNNGAAFLEVPYRLMQQAKPGDFYLFRNIKGLYPDGNTFTLPGFFIEITE